jgi:hypothetical protein
MFLGNVSIYLPLSPHGVTTQRSNTEFNYSVHVYRMFCVKLDGVLVLTLRVTGFETCLAFIKCIWNCHVVLALVGPVSKRGISTAYAIK